VIAGPPGWSGYPAYFFFLVAFFFISVTSFPGCARGRARCITGRMLGEGWMPVKQKMQPAEGVWAVAPYRR
jgi:hypothetical protein